MADAASVHEAVARVMAALPSIGRDSTADPRMGGYPFRGIEAITRHVQPLLAEHGVVIVPHSVVESVVPAPGFKEGWQDTYLRVRWTVYGPDGSSFAAQTNGVGRDNSDKGTNKAQTQAFKYLLLHLFCIADAKDDADGQEYGHARVAEAPAPLKMTSKQQTEIAKGTASLSEVAAGKVKTWWKDQGFPPLDSKQLTRVQADAILEFLPRAQEQADAEAELVKEAS